jgi:hypothetical protein
VVGEEAAWEPTIAIWAVEWLRAHDYAILGTELWRPTGESIQSLPHFQSVSHKDHESWRSFVARAAAETLTYLSDFGQKVAEEGHVYVNLTWVNETQFQSLQSHTNPA